LIRDEHPREWASSDPIHQAAGRAGQSVGGLDVGGQGAKRRGWNEAQRRLGGSVSGITGRGNAEVGDGRAAQQSKERNPFAVRMESR